MRTLVHRPFVWSWFAFAVFGSVGLFAAEDAPPKTAAAQTADLKKEALPDKTLAPSLAIKIADEPRAIDPAALLPRKLAALATGRFEEKSLREIVEWLRKEQKLDIQIDLKAFEEATVDLFDPFTEELANEPVYLLLNRLSARRIAWYIDDDVVHLTSVTAQENHQYTVSYLLGDLLDAGYRGGDELVQVLHDTIEPTTWKANGGQGSAVILGDVLFVRQTSKVHLQVAGLLAAYKNFGRRTFILDHPANHQLRELLDQPVTVKLRNLPFGKALTELSKAAKTSIRIDQVALEEAAFDQRTPVEFDAVNQKLRHLLAGMATNYGLTWVVRDGAIWITSKTAAENEQRTAVYDVRDLCRDDSENDSLIHAICEQSNPTTWKMNGGQGDLTFAKTGVMVVSQTEPMHDEVLRLLENYRTALRNSKPRVETKKDTKPVKIYYRIPQAMARELVDYIPAEVKPETWQSKAQPQAIGTIKLLSSEAELRDPKGTLVADETKAEAKNLLVVPQAVLVITQTEEVHYEIESLIGSIRQGTSIHEPVFRGMGGLGGGGMGGGGPGAFGGAGPSGQGFGNGFFSVPSK